MKKFIPHLFILGGMLTTAISSYAQKPNIVFILADDLGIGDLGAYGQQLIKTPVLDSLSRTGMVFQNFYAGTSVCAPSRSSLMTGKHTGHTYIRGNKEIEPEGQEPLADSITTLAMLLKQSGYVTGAFGKWGLGMINSSGDPQRKGFDEFYGYICQRQSHRYYPTHLWHNQTRIELPDNGLLKQHSYAPELIQQQTLAFIDKHQKEPFFLYVPSVLPHAELTGPNDEYVQQYEGLFEEHPHQGNDYGPQALVPGYSSVRNPRATYAGMVSRLDAYVGQIVDKLRSLGLLENTLIVFSSDNGAHQEGGADPDFFNSSAGLRGYKRDLYEGGIKVPFIANWAGVISGGQQQTQLGAFWDLLPTFVALSQGTGIRDADGVSLLPTLLQQGTQEQHPYLYWEFHEDGGRQAVRQGDWKLIIQQVRGKQEIALFQLVNDPKEQHNIASRYPQKVQELQGIIQQAHRPSAIFPLK